MSEQHPIRQASNFKNLIGVRFSRLIAIAYCGYNGHSTSWLCRCDCGKEVKISRSHLTGGHTQSCGCLREVRGIGLTKHGLSRSGSYKSWSTMIKRCTDPSSGSYIRYGGAGVIVCPEWLESFESFFAAMGHRPDGHTLDRINSSKGYEPNNCKWSTLQEQCRHRKSNRILTLRGESASMAEWSERTGLSYSTIKMRLHHGWTEEKCLTTPPCRSRR